MKIESIDAKGSFVVRNESRELIKLFYEKWFSSQAKTELNGVEITIKPKGFWQSKFDILKNGIDKGDIVFNWKGVIIITSTDKIGNSKEWIVKTKGLTNYRFEVYNGNQELTLKLKPHYNWKSFKFNYDVEILKNDIPENEIIELILYAGFGTNRHRSKRSKIAI